MDLEALKNMYKSNVDTHGLQGTDAMARSLAYIDKASWERRQYAAARVFANTPLEVVRPRGSIWSVLDVGCGTGELLYNFPAEVSLPAHYVGVDMVEEFIRYAKDDWTGFEFHLGTYTDLYPTITGAYDYTFAMGTFAFMDEPTVYENLDLMWADTIYACTFDLPASHYTPGHILTSFIHPRQPYAWVLRHEHNTYTVYMYKNPKSNDQEN